MEDDAVCTFISTRSFSSLSSTIMNRAMSGGDVVTVTLRSYIAGTLKFFYPSYTEGRDMSTFVNASVSLGNGVVDEYVMRCLEYFYLDLGYFYISSSSHMLIPVIDIDLPKLDIDYDRQYTNLSSSILDQTFVDDRGLELDLYDINEIRAKGVQPKHVYSSIYLKNFRCNKLISIKGGSLDVEIENA